MVKEEEVAAGEEEEEEEVGENIMYFHLVGKTASAATDWTELCTKGIRRT